MSTRPPVAPPAPIATAAAPAVASRNDDDEEDYDESFWSVKDVGNFAASGTTVTGVLLSIIVLIGAGWAYQYSGHVIFDPNNASLDINQTTTITNGSTNQNTTVVIGGTGTSTNSVSYSMPVRTDRTSLFLWTLCAVLAASMIAFMLVTLMLRMRGHGSRSKRE